MVGGYERKRVMKSERKRGRWSEREVELQRRWKSTAVKLQVIPDNELSQCC